MSNSSGVTTADLPSMRPDDLSERLRRTVDEGTVSVPGDFQPDRRELRTVIDRLRRRR